MRKKILAVVLSTMMVASVLGGCGGSKDSSDKGASSADAGSSSADAGSDAGDDAGASGDDKIVVGFSQVGAESDWRTANTQSMKETFVAENGYELIFDDAQQKQENQITAIRNFIQQEVDYIVLAPVTETGWDTVLKEAQDADIPVIIVLFRY